ncbi:hypothetical protein [Delftia tsuruhatensis]|uniref:hypothetical protein n=1 Tax=Delftia tsuruhatensis TaxID=180282 RepID=UPI001F189062|nr:hypothetical protein [Delftia tsuruhatensis]
MTDGPAHGAGMAGLARDLSAPRPLQAGPLRAELAGGGLRHVRYGGIEILRSLAFVVRDGEGEKCMAEPGDIDVRQEVGRFEVFCDAVSVCEGRSLAWRVRILGTAHGLNLAAWACTRGGIGRGGSAGAGLEILYPGQGLAGRSIQVEHVDGSIVQTVMPEPDALLHAMSGLRTITHEPAPGLRVGCCLEGANFQMQGQGRGSQGVFRLRPQPAMAHGPSPWGDGRTLVQMACLVFGRPDDAPQALARDTL